LNSYPSIKEGFSILGIFLVASVLASVIAMGISPAFGKEVSFFVSYLLSVGGTFFITNTIRKSKTSLSGFNFEIEDHGILPYITMIAIAIPYGVTVPLVSLIPMPDFVIEFIMNLGQYNGIWSFMTIVIAGPVLEELIFRGIVLEGFLKRYTPLKSILMSSLLFGIFHLNPWQFVTAMVIGTFIGWVYYRTRSITLAIFIHITNNLVAFLSSQFTETKFEDMDQTIVEFYGGIVPFLSITITALVIIGYGIYVLNQKMDHAPKPIVEELKPVVEETSDSTHLDNQK
jgi:uncharacterized protein